MKKLANWKYQMFWSFVALVVINVTHFTIYPFEVYRTHQAIYDSGNYGPLMVLSATSLIAQVVFVVGLVRGLIVLVKRAWVFARDK